MAVSAEATTAIDSSGSGSMGGDCQSTLINSAQRFNSGTVWKTSFILTVIGIASISPTSPHK